MKRRQLACLVLCLAALWVPALAQAQTTLNIGRIFFAAGPRDLAGSADPEGSMAAPMGSTYRRTNGTFYVKVSGSGNTGWMAVPALTLPLTVPNGGTGAATFTVNGVLFGNGTSPLGVTSAPGVNTVLAGNSSTPFFTTTPTVGQVTATAQVNTPVVTNTGQLTLNPTGDLITDPAGNDILPVTNYDINIGAPLLKYLSLRAAELNVDTLVARDVISTVGGEILVVPTTTLTADLDPAGGTITVFHNQIANGDRIRMEARGLLEFMNVTSVAGGSAGAYTYSVTRDQDGTGANAWIKGDAVANTGTTGDGMLHLYAESGLLAGFGPTITCLVRTGTAYNAMSPRCAMGNLNAIGYGHATDVYGFAAGNPAGAYFYIDDTNGLVMAGPGGTKVQIAPSGDASFSGTVTAAAGAIGGFNIGADYLRDAANSFGLKSTVTGGNDCRFWAGDTYANCATAPFRVFENGAMAAASGLIGGFEIGANYIRDVPNFAGFTSFESGGDDVVFWAGDTFANRNTASFRVTQLGVVFASNATISGAITATSGSFAGTVTATSGTIGGWTLGTTSLTAGSGSTTVGLDSGGSNPAIYAGSATPGSAPFRVTNAGALVATNAEITGAITATSGSFTGDGGGVTNIDGGNIQASSIDADRLNVTTLSAITANLGTVTAGSITGVTISGGTVTGGAGNVVLSSTGVTIAAGTSATNRVKWSDGSYIESNGGVLLLEGADEVALVGPVSMNLGTFTLTGSAALKSESFDGAGTLFVCADNSGVFFGQGVACDMVPGRSSWAARVEVLERRLAVLEADWARVAVFLLHGGLR